MLPKKYQISSYLNHLLGVHGDLLYGRPEYLHGLDLVGFIAEYARAELSQFPAKRIVKQYLLIFQFGYICVNSLCVLYGGVGAELCLLRPAPAARVGRGEGVPHHPGGQQDEQVLQQVPGQGVRGGAEGAAGGGAVDRGQAPAEAVGEAEVQAGHDDVGNNLRIRVPGGTGELSKHLRRLFFCGDAAPAQATKSPLISCALLVTCRNFFPFNVFNVSGH